MVKFSKYLTASFELQIWFIGIGLAAIRSIVGVIDDLAIQPIHYEELIVDSILTILFSVMGIRIFFGKLNHIPIWISFVLILLIAINYMQFGGVGNGVEFNLLGIGILLILANKKKQLRYVMPFYFCVLLLVIAENHFIGFLPKFFFIQNQNGFLDFILMLITISTIVLYFKQIIMRESINAHKINSQLLHKKNIIQKQNEKLEEQKHLISLTNERLQSELMSHTDKLMKQNKSIQKFVYHMTKSLENPVENISENANSLKSNDSVEHMIKQSVDDLTEVTFLLNKQLLSEKA